MFGTRKRTKALIDSLLREFPVGGIPTWRTDQPPDLKNVNVNLDSVTKKVYQVLLDGQQRTTALFMLLTNKIPHYYYSDQEIVYDPRELAFNIFSRELKYWQSSMKNDPCWQLVTDCMLGKPDADAMKIAFKHYKQYQKLAEIENFEFNFEIEPKYSAYGHQRTLIESAGLTMYYLSLIHI